MGKALTSNEVTKNMTQWIADQTKGGLSFAKNFNPTNALKAALLILSETKSGKKDGYRPVLEVCSAPSIYMALQKMLTYGLNPAKKQCYFIAYGGKMEMQESYFGILHMAKEMANVAKVNTQVIYENDDFEIGINQLGEKTVVKHTQSLENMDNKKIKGAYAVVIYNDKTFKTEIMNFAQIKKSWEQSQYGVNDKTHGNFAEEMAKKTVLRRALKTDVNSSNDNNLVIDDEPDYKEEVKADIVENSGQVELSIDFTETIDSETGEIMEAVEGDTLNTEKEEKVVNKSDETADEVTVEQLGF